MTYVVDWEIEATSALRPAGPEPEGGNRWDGLLPSSPGGLCVTATGAVVVTEPDADRVRWVRPAAVTTVGNGPGWQDGPVGVAQFRHPLGIATAPGGWVIVADTDNHAIRRVGPDGRVDTLAGGTYGEGDGAGGQARFRHPSAVAVAGDGTIVVADTVNNTIRSVSPDGQVDTLAGSIYGRGGVQASRLSFRRPEAVALGADGSVYVADTGNDRVCRIDPSGRSTLVAGRRAPGLPAAPAAELRWPTALLVLPDDTVYVTDACHNLVHRIDPDGRATALAADPTWRPVALAALSDGAVLAAEARWAVGRTTGRLRTLPTP